MKTRNGKWAVNISKSNTAPIGRKSSEWKVMVQRYRPATDEKVRNFVRKGRSYSNNKLEFI